MIKWENEIDLKTKRKLEAGENPTEIMMFALAELHGTVLGQAAEIEELKAKLGGESND